MWTRVAACLLFHVTSWIMTFCSEETREFHAGVFEVKTLLGSNHTKKTNRLLECVYSCIEDSECRSVSYSKTVCHLHSSPVTVTRDHSSTILYANVREENGPILRKGKMSWREAEEKCWDFGELITIDCEAKQIAAEKLVNNSGLDYVAIGVYKKNLQWVDFTEKAIRYAAWDGGKPSFIGLYGALSRRKGYKWEALSVTNVNGRICQKKKDDIQY